MKKILSVLLLLSSLLPLTAKAQIKKGYTPPEWVVLSVTKDYRKLKENLNISSERGIYTFSNAFDTKEVCEICNSIDVYPSILVSLRQSALDILSANGYDQASAIEYLSTMKLRGFKITEIDDYNFLFQSPYDLKTSYIYPIADNKEQTFKINGNSKKLNQIKSNDFDEVSQSFNKLFKKLDIKQEAIYTYGISDPDVKKDYFCTAVVYSYDKNAYNKLVMEIVGDCANYLTENSSLDINFD